MNITYVLRSYLGLTQSKLAQKAGITQPDLSEIETKEPYGFVDKYVRLSKALGVPVEALLKNDFTLIPEEFFQKYPKPAYTPPPASPDHLMGRQGEELILRRERVCVAERYPVLSNLILPYYKMKGPSPGYDILSFDECGKPIFLEVKTSTHATNGFRLTNHELDTAQKMTAQGERYHIVYISNWGTEHQAIQEIPFAQLEQTHRISPCYFFCKPIPKAAKRPVSGMTYFRRKKQLRQADLAEMLGITQSELSLYENGIHNPSVNLYIQISMVLDVTVDQLLETYEPASNEEDVSEVA